MTKSTRDVLGILFIVSILAIGAVIGPLLLLWSLNTLFPVLSIPYNFYTWLAAAFINATIYFRYKQQD